VAEALLDRDADVNATCSYSFDLKERIGGVTALKIAMCEGHSELVRLLLSRGADPNSWDNARQTPLLFVADSGHPERI
jgi:ankyrin repeat protein